MSWTGPNLSFLLISIVVIIPAFFAAFSNSVVRAAFSLFFTLFGMAGYYLLLGSDFIAVTQVIIYVGGILVLIMFGVLLTNRSFPSTVTCGLRQTLMLALPALALFSILSAAVFSGAWKVKPIIESPQPSIRQLGHALLESYLPALEIAGVTLLLCLIGAAYLVRREER